MVKRATKMSVESREKMRVAKLGKPSNNLGHRSTRSIKFREAARQRVLGDKNPNWKGGNSLSYRIRRLAQYIEWRRKIYIRDNFTCQECKEQGVRLNADHTPLSFAELLHTKNIVTINDAILCNELWDIDNGRTLCEDCHRQTDTYGKRYIKKIAH